jgi:hypothetical protein
VTKSKLVEVNAFNVLKLEDARSRCPIRKTRASGLDPGMSERTSRKCDHPYMPRGELQLERCLTHVQPANGVSSQLSTGKTFDDDLSLHWNQNQRRGSGTSAHQRSCRQRVSATAATPSGVYWRRLRAVWRFKCLNTIYCGASWSYSATVLHLLCEVSSQRQESFPIGQLDRQPVQQFRPLHLPYYCFVPTEAARPSHLR